MDNPQNAEAKRNIVLVTLYRLATRGTKSHISVFDLERESNIGDEFKPVLDFLRHKQLLTKRNLDIQITVSGIEETETIMGNKKRQVLEKLHKLANGHIEIVSVSNLAQSLGLDFDQTYDDLRYWEERGLVEMSHDVDREHEMVKFTRPGLDAIERPDKDGTPGGHIIYNLSLHNNQGNIAMGGQGHHQSVVNHQPISEILPKLAELIEAVRRADFEDKDEVVRDLEKVQQLAQSEDPKSKWTLIQSKLSSAKTGMEIVGFGYNSLPYWPAIWQYFFG